MMQVLGPQLSQAEKETKPPFRPGKSRRRGGISMDETVQQDASPRCDSEDEDDGETGCGTDISEDGRATAAP